MQNIKHKAEETAHFIRKRIQQLPEIGFLTGTGLGDSAEGLETDAVLDYQDIPNFPVSTVESHKGRLLVGRLGKKTVAAMQGRFHLYEGYSPAQVTFPIRVMQELGVRILIVSNAAGGFNPDFQPGDIMTIADHINLTGENPLVGPNEDRWGIRFPDMGAAYDRELAALARNAGEPLREGVYAGLKGPSLETPAEVRFLRLIGADAVGFSTVQETITAVHAGMRVLGLSIITNVHNPDAPEPATVEEIIEVAAQAAPKLQNVIRYVTENLS